MICSCNPQSSSASNAMGGVLGFIGSAGVIAVWFAKGQYAVLVVGLAYLLDKSSKVILEGSYTRVCASGTIDRYVTTLQVASWIGFMIYSARIKEPATIASDV